MKLIKRTLAVLLSILMLFGTMPMTVFADVTANGFCGDSVRWELDDEGTLTLSGDGRTDD